MFAFLRKRKERNRVIAYNQMLVQKAYPLARRWMMEMENCNDPARADRILRHMRRIAKVQLRAQARLKSYY